MLQGSILCKGPLSIFTLLYLFICWPVTGICLDLLNGEVTANVKLKRTPDLEGKVITVLDKGDRVVIQEKDGEWFRVALETEEYGYRGWVYGGYVKQLPPQDQVSPVTPGEIIPKARLKGKTEKASLCGEKEVFAPCPGGRQVDIRPFEPASATREAVRPAPGALSSENRRVLVIKKGPASHGRSMGQVSAQGEPGKIAWLPSAFTDRPGGHQMAALIRLLLRFSSVILACLALILSCRALRSARVCLKAVMPVHQELLQLSGETKGPNAMDLHERS